MEYPVQVRRRKMLEYLYKTLDQRHRAPRNAHEVLNPGLSLRIEHYGAMLDEGTSPQQYLAQQLSDQVGLNLHAAEIRHLIEVLHGEEYIAADYRQSLLSDARYYIKYLTDKGLREIGQLPDPHAELMQRLDLAIQQIQQDPRLSAHQKRQAINWLQEGTTIARTLTIDAIKVILAGVIV
jgi:hypothetical protein